MTIYRCPRCQRETFADEGKVCSRCLQEDMPTAQRARLGPDDNVDMSDDVTLCAACGKALYTHTVGDRVRCDDKWRDMVIEAYTSSLVVPTKE